MNHSLYGADRSTHLKIVVVGFLCAVVVAAVGMYARVGDDDAPRNSSRPDNRPPSRAGFPSFANTDWSVA